MKAFTLERAAALTVCLFGGGVAAYLFFRYLFWPLFPFALAWGLAFLLRPFCRFCHRRLSLPLPFVSALTVLLAFLLLTLPLGYGLVRLLGEAKELLVVLTEGEGSAFLSALLGESEVIRTLLSRLTSSLLELLAPLAGRVLTSLPDFLLSLVVTVLASVYFSMDLEGINGAARRLLGERAGVLSRLRRGAAAAGGNYVRAYLFLLSVTFLLLLLGFLLLGIPYAILFALLVSLADLLPVIGVGTVLYPWALVLLLTGNTAGGIGMAILGAVIGLVRQVIEPRVLGKSFGIHPLLGLASLYLGGKLFGIGGMILAPPAVAFLSGLKRGETDE